jgi:L-arabinose isomerase
MMELKKKEVWYVTGSQHLYGDETLQKVAEHSQTIAASLHASSQIPVSVVYKPTVKSAEEIYAVCMEANAAKIVSVSSRGCILSLLLKCGSVD